MLDWKHDSEAVLNRFNRLISELLKGTFSRNCFRPWEVELLLDIESCNLTGANRREILRRYQRAVQRHIENGGAYPLKLSEYLASKRLKAKAREQDGSLLTDELADNQPAVPV